MNHNLKNRLTTTAASCITAIAFVMRAGADDFNDFNAGTLPGWAFSDVTALLNSIGVPGTYAYYTFPPDGHGGKALEVSTPTLPSVVGSQAGPPRAAAYPKTVYTRFQMQTDFLNWNNTNNQAIGLLFYANDVGPGTTYGYIMNYNVRGANLEFNVVLNEAANNAAIGAVHLPMDPSRHTYRWELTGYDGNLLGRVFQFPDTNNPISSVIATDSTTTSGVISLFNFDRSDPPYVGTDMTVDNYHAFVPPAGSLAAVPVYLSPAPGDTVALAQPVISIAVLDRETTADRSSFSLAVDGVAAPSNQISVSEGVNEPGTSVPFGGVTVSYTPSAPLSAAVHQVQSVYADNLGTRYTNTWTFTAAYLTNPIVGTPGLSGFNVFIVQAPQNPQLPNSLAIADQQLTEPSPIARLYASNLVAPYINYDIRAFNGTVSSPFGNDLPFPGQTDTTTVRNWALRADAYVQLPSGVVTLGVKHDDGFRVTYGNQILGQYDGGTGDHPFSFYVAQAGLYPLTLEWNQSGGDAYVYWYEVTPGEHEDTDNKVLLNTQDGYAAYTSVITPPQLLASSSLHTPMIVVPNAIYDDAALTFTVPLAGSGPDQFYRVSAPGRGNVADIKIVNGNVVIHFTPAP